MITNSVHDGASLDLTSAACILAAAYALTAIVIIEPVHLSLGIDFISRSRGQSTGSGAGDELAASQARFPRSKSKIKVFMIPPDLLRLIFSYSVNRPLKS